MVRLHLEVRVQGIVQQETVVHYCRSYASSYFVIMVGSIEKIQILKVKLQRQFTVAQVTFPLLAFALTSGVSMSSRWS